MPTDRRVSAGERIRIPADTWNDVLETVRRARGSRLGSGGSGPLADAVGASVVVLIQNATGAALDEGACLAIGDALVTVGIDFADEPIFSGDTPASATDAVAVLVEPLANGEIGRAVIQGVAVATVDVGSVGHGYASPASGDAFLTSGTTGPVRILSTPGGTGSQTVAVLLTGAPPTGVTVGAFDGSPSYPDIVSIEIDEAQGGVVTQPGAGRAKISWASASLTSPGVIDTTSQTIAGAKNFKDFTTFHDEITIENGYSSGAPTVSDPARINFEGAALSPGGSLFQTEVMTYRKDWAIPVTNYYNWSAATRIVSGSVYLQTVLTYNAETGLHTFDLHRGAFTGSTVSGTAATCAYALDGVLGATATVAGMEFTGGLYTGGTASVVTSVGGSGGTTGLSFSGGPITSSGTLTLGGTLAPENGGTGQTDAFTFAYMWGTD